MKRLKLASLTLGMAVAVLVPAYPAAAATEGNVPPGPPAVNHNKADEGGAYVYHCQAYGDGPGTIVFTAGRVGHPGRVNDNCRDG